MTTVTADKPVQTLEDRLTRGAELLLDMELRGETGETYEVWLERWRGMLREYERAQAA